MAIFNRCNVAVKIKGTVPAREFQHEGLTFIEGRKGSEFEIEITNTSSRRILAVVSVDGIGVIDGKKASHDSSGYIINANSSVTIPGWLLNDKEVAKFVFSDINTSYSKSVDPSAESESYNCGVIGVAVWNEIVPSPVFRRVDAGFPLGQDPFSKPMYGTSGATSYYNNTLLAQTQTVSTTSLSASVEPVTQSLGTGFGEAMDFGTTKTAFNKDRMIETACIFYDSLTGLKKRGIDVSPPKNVIPNPFPESYCTPPAGWIYR